MKKFQTIPKIAGRGPALKKQMVGRSAKVARWPCMVLAVWLVASTMAYAQTNGFTNRFNYANNTAYTQQLCARDAGNCEYWLGNGNTVVQDGNLRVRFQKGQFGTKAGFVGRSRVNGDRVYTLQYRLKFDNGFDWRLGGKLPGLAGGSAPSGGGRPTDGKGFTTRFMWRSGGRLVVYAYYRDQTNYYGDDWDVGVTFKTGAWYTIKQRVTVNTGGSYNGKVEVWINGGLKLVKTGLRLMTVGNTVNRVHYDTFMGGNDPSWAPNHTQYLRLDDFVCAKGGGGGNGGQVSVQVNARGANGTEKIEILRNGARIGSVITLGTSNKAYTVTTKGASGTFRVRYINDGPGKDVVCDWLKVGNQLKQAESRQVNTGAWGNNRCGGGSYTEYIHCNGYIDFGSYGGAGRFAATIPENRAAAEGIRVAPNPIPAGGYLAIGWPEGQGRDANLSLLDANGQNIQHKVAQNQSSLQWQIGTGVPQGVYLLKVESKNTVAFKKILVTH